MNQKKYQIQMNHLMTKPRKLKNDIFKKLKKPNSEKLERSYLEILQFYESLKIIIRKIFYNKSLKRL